MSSLTAALGIAQSGLQVSQAGLSTVSNNIVNANTAGYSRETVNTSEVAYNNEGAGVTIQGISRTVDQRLQLRALQQQSDVSYATTKSGALTDIENSLTNANGASGLDTMIGNFFDGASTLANDPSNSSLKTNLVSQATQLTDNLNSASQDLQNQQQNADGAITDTLSSLNTTLQQLYQLNNQIAVATGSGGGSGANTSSLQDQRDQLVSTLSQTFKLQVTTDTSDGAYRISTESGRKLVDESSYVQFTRTPPANGSSFQGIGFQTVQADGSLSPNVTTLNTNALTSGTLKAEVDIRDTVLPNQIAQLNQLTSTFANAVNMVTSTGSSVPPQKTLTSGNTQGLSNVTSNLFAASPAGLGSSLAGSTFNISVTDGNGNPITTTAGNSLTTPAVTDTPITLPSSGPFSLNDLANLINNNPTIGNTALGGTAGVIATATTDANGHPILQITSANSSNKVVMADVSGTTLGTLGMNNFFTGTSSASTIAVRSDIVVDSSLVPTGAMRSTDGGLSSLNSDTALALSQVADTKLNFAAAGGLGAQTATVTGYTDGMLSNLAVNIQDGQNRQTAATTLLTSLQSQQSSQSGVNMNEELSLMLTYQQSFQASARIVNTVSDMLQELMTMASNG